MMNDEKELLTADERADVLNAVNKMLINVRDEINKATVGFGKATESLLDAIDKLEPYQRYELLHPQKKPRGSIRRRRQNENITSQSI